MHGSLAFSKGVVFVGRCAKTARVTTFDLDGHRLEGGFTFRDERAGRSSVAGMCVDADHRVWVADPVGGRVRAFTLFGRPVVDVADPDPTGLDRRGNLGRPVDVAVQGLDDQVGIAVASAGLRRHALQVFHPHSGRVMSLRPESGPRGCFRGLHGLTWVGERFYVCDADAVHVYEHGALHWSVRLPVAGEGKFRPSAVAVLDSGAMVVACCDPAASALVLCEPGGRVLRVLATGGEASGEVDEPLDVVVDEHAEGGPRAVVIDRAGQRVQVITLEGRCFGEFSAV